MKSNLLFILILLIFTACINKQEKEYAETPKSTHNIYGKWKNALEDKRFSNFKITIKENNTLEIEQTIPNRESEFKVHQLIIIDEQTATFFYTSTINEESVSVKINVQDKDLLKFKCFLTEHPEVQVMLDPPILCFTQEFIRVNTEL